MVLGFFPIALKIVHSNEEIRHSEIFFAPFACSFVKLIGQSNRAMYPCFMLIERLLPL